MVVVVSVGREKPYPKRHDLIFDRDAQTLFLVDHSLAGLQINHRRQHFQTVTAETLISLHSLHKAANLSQSETSHLHTTANELILEREFVRVGVYDVWSYAKDQENKDSIATSYAQLYTALIL